MTSLFDRLDPPPRPKAAPAQPEEPSDGITRRAHFPRPGVRLSLTRFWAPGPRALWVGYNPSDAGTDRDDPTSHRITHFTRSWKLSGYDVVNQYPWVAPDPSVCRQIRDREEPGSMVDIWEAGEVRDKLAASAVAVIACWGDLAIDKPEWTDHIVHMLARAITKKPVKIYCLGTTASGSPIHPMARGKSRVPDDQKPIVWREF